MTDTQTPRFKRTKAISTPQLKLSVNSTYYIKIHGPIIEKQHPDPKYQQAMHIVTVIDLEDGEIKQVILDKIPYEVFMDMGEELIGKSFEITKLPKQRMGTGSEEKQSYHPYSIHEIDPDQPQETN